MQMAKSKLYRMPLSTEMIREIEEKQKMAKVCAGCSLRHIFKPEEELVELDEEGLELTSFHIDCAPKHTVATKLQFMQQGFDEKKAQEKADKLNNRVFKLRQEDTEKSEPIELESA